MFNLQSARKSDFLQQAAVLLGGNAGAALLSLISLSITARALGVETFGALILVVTLVTFADKLISSQSWTSVIRYGTHAIASENVADVRAILRVGLLLDVAGAVLSAAAASGAGWLIHFLGGWDRSVAWLVTLYATTTLFHVNGMFIGVLRMRARYGLLSSQALISAALKLVLVAAAWALGAPEEGFLAAWAVADIAGSLLLGWWGWREIGCAQWGGFQRESLRGFRTRFPRFWQFTLANNLGTALRQATKEADVLIVGAFLGNFDTGIYKVIKQLGSLAQRLIDPLSQIVYPELTKAYAVNNYARIRALCWGTSALGLLAGVTLWVAFYRWGTELIHTTVGSQFETALLPGLWYFAGVAISAALTPLQPLSLAMGRPGGALWASALATIAYFLSMAVSLPVLGLFGAGGSHIVFHLVSAVCLIYVIRNVGLYFRRA